MRRILQTLGLVSIVLLVLAQFVSIDRTNPPVESDVPAPAEAKAALRRACYDCHSNETVWPWYSRVAPVSWLLAYDVIEGREELNFSTWGRYDSARQRKKLAETIETLKEGEMPPGFYTIMHPAARLADADRQAIVAWASAARAEAPSTGLAR
jgi:cytochrome c553